MNFVFFIYLIAARACIGAALPTDVKNFLLVTTSQVDANAEPAELRAVSATSLYVSDLSIRFPIFLLCTWHTADKN